MDSVVVQSDRNYEKKAEEVQPLVPGLPQLAVTPVQNESNGLLKLPEPIRSRKSFCLNPELPVSRRPSAIVSAVQQQQQQQDHRRPSSSNLFLE